MTITVPTKPFREALAKLQPITSAKGNLPQLGGVRIIPHGSGGYAEILATNLDLWMTVSIEDVASDNRQDFAVSSRDLYDTLRYIYEEETLLSVTDNYCEVKAGRSNAKLPLIVDPMPVLPDAKWGKPFIVENLPELLSKCLPFSSTDPNRYILNSVYFSPAGLVANNGRYSLIRIKVPIAGEANVPSSAAALVAKEKGSVTCRFSASMAEFSGDGWSLTTKLIEAADGSKYPSIKEVIERKVKHRLAVERIEAIKAAAFAALPLPPELDTISAEHTATELRFFSPASCPNPKSKVITAKADQDHSWAVSARKLATTLHAFDCDVVDIGFTDVQSVIIEDGNIMAALSLCRI